MQLSHQIIYITLLTLPIYLIRFRLFNGLDILLFVTFLVSLKPIWHNWRKPTTFHWLSLAFIFAGALSVLIAESKSLALGAYKSWVVLPVLFSWAVFAVKPAWYIVQRNLLIMAGYTSLWAFLQYVVMRHSRLIGWYDSPNFFAFMAVPILLVTLPLLNKKSPLWYVGVWIIVAIALCITFSVGGVLALVGGIVIYYLARNYPAQWTSRAVALIAIISVAITFLPITHVTSDLAGRSDSLTARTQIWAAGHAIAKSHPLWGVGLRHFASYYENIIPTIAFPPVQWGVPQPHNLALALWLNLGIIGLLSFGLTTYLAIKKLTLRLPNSTTASLVAGLSGILIHGAIDTPYFHNELAVLFWTLIAISAGASYD